MERHNAVLSKIPAKAIDKIKDFAKSYNALSEDKIILRVVIIPSSLTAVGVFCLASRPMEVFILEWRSLIFITLTLLYIFLTSAKFYVDYKNVVVERRRNNRLLSLASQIKHLDECVLAKKKALIGAIIKNKSDSNLLKKCYDTVDYKTSSIVINERLAKAIHSFLKDTEHLHGADIACCLLEANQANQFYVRTQYATGGAYYVNPMIQIYVDDRHFLASQLWSRTDARLYESFASTIEANKKDKFLFRSSDEKDSVKSIFCYKLVDPLTANPFAIWCLHADRENVFPNIDDDRFKELSNIVISFAERMLLERVYREILNRSSNILKIASEIERNNEKSTG